jgi:hypothetical protein
MGFIEDFFRKKPKEVTNEDLNAFLTRKIEENLNLDYKAIQAYYDFDKLSKDVSAFANSEGGLLILGISQDKIKKGKVVVKVLPKELTWGEEILSKETLEDNLVGKIQPRIDGIKIQPVREGNGSMRVIFLIEYCRSQNPKNFIVKAENIGRNKKGKREYLNNSQTCKLLMKLEAFLDAKVEIPRIKNGRSQKVETLISEETLLFAKYLRNERKKWQPRITFLEKVF